MDCVDDSQLGRSGGRWNSFVPPRGYSLLPMLALCVSAGWFGLSFFEGEKYPVVSRSLLDSDPLFAFWVNFGGTVFDGVILFVTLSGLELAFALLRKKMTIAHAWCIFIAWLLPSLALLLLCMLWMGRPYE